ncbi:hypothetical protein DRQ33_06665, partial [bacterium]
IMVKNTTIFIIVGVITLFAQNRYSVNEITISTSHDSTFILAITSGTPDFKKIATDAPPRIAIDFFDGIYNLPKDEFSRMPPGIVAAVRGSQREPLPKPISRIVLDLVEPAKDVSVRKHPEGVMIAIPTPEYPQFGKWTSGRKEPSPDAAKALAESVVVSESIAVVSDTITAEAKETTAVTEKPIVPLTEEEVPAELAMYMRPETLLYKGITADMETIEVAKYIRNMVIYAPKGDDPFIIPKRTKEIPIGSEPLAMVENLSVVGIVHAGDARMAILEDETGFGYILTEGDSIEGGKCTTVTDTSAVFTLSEFGQLRKLELPLVNPKKGQDSKP